MWPGPRERGGGERWIEKEARAGRGGGREREGRRAVSGGERAQLMMKQGRAGVRAHCTFSSSTRRAHAQGGVGRELEGGGGTRCTSPEEESHSKHSQMIKGFWDNLQHPTFRFMEKMNRLSFHFRAAAASSSITDIFFLFLTYMSFKTKCQEAREANMFTQ